MVSGLCYLTHVFENWLWEDLHSSLFTDHSQCESLTTTLASRISPRLVNLRYYSPLEKELKLLIIF